ncbi:MAG: SHOCT domain-containing protein [Solirubrobacterales bacterium]
MPVAEFSLGEALLTVLSVFVFMAWILVLFTILSDLFRDHETSGGVKAVWVFFLIFLPFVTALVYLIVRGSGMRERALTEQKHAQEQISQYVKATAGGSSADELTKLAKLRDDGVISAEEFESQKAKLLA